MNSLVGRMFWTSLSEEAERLWAVSGNKADESIGVACSQLEPVISATWITSSKFSWLEDEVVAPLGGVNFPRILSWSEYVIRFVNIIGQNIEKLQF